MVLCLSAEASCLEVHYDKVKKLKGDAMLFVPCTYPSAFNDKVKTCYYRVVPCCLCPLHT